VIFERISNVGTERRKDLGHALGPAERVGDMKGRHSLWLRLVVTRYEMLRMFNSRSIVTRD